jgi:hypothetical protein
MGMQLFDVQFESHGANPYPKVGHLRSRRAEIDGHPSIDVGKGNGHAGHLHGATGTTAGPSLPCRPAWAVAMVAIVVATMVAVARLMGDGVTTLRLWGSAGTARHDGTGHGDGQM